MTNLTPDGQNVQGVLMHEIHNARVVQSFQGEEDVELAKGTLRMLLVSVAVNPFSDAHGTSGGEKQKAPANGGSDIWLALEVGPDFSLPVKASQTVLPERQSGSYLFPSEDVPGASIRLTFDHADQKAIHDFEDLLSDYCAFRNDSSGKGTLELLDENGQLLGTIDGPWQLNEDAGMHKPGHEKDPVMLELPEKDGQQSVQVSAAPRDEDGELPASYQNDWLVRGAHMVSSTLVKGSAWAGARMLQAADSYVSKSTPPTSRRDSFADGQEGRGEKQGAVVGQGSGPGPAMTSSGRAAVTFSPQTHEAARSIRNVSGKVCTVSNRTTTAILGAAANVGDQIGKRTGIQKRVTPDGTATQPKGVRGALNRSLVAFNVVLDGVTNSAERLLKDSGEASGRMIEHRYGSEAKVVSGNVASVGRSAFVVYKDVMGVRRKALLKVATGTIRARAPDGSEVILQHGPEKTVQGGGASTSVQPSQTSSYPQQSGSGQANDPPPYNPYVRSSQTKAMTEKRLIMSKKDPERSTLKAKASCDWLDRASPLDSIGHSAALDEALPPPTAPSWPMTPLSHGRRHNGQRGGEDDTYGCSVEHAGDGEGGLLSWAALDEDGLKNLADGQECKPSQSDSAQSVFACTQQSTHSSSMVFSTNDCITPSKMVDSAPSSQPTARLNACETPRSGGIECRDLFRTPNHHMRWTPTASSFRNESPMPHSPNHLALSQLWLSPSKMDSSPRTLLLPSTLLSQHNAAAAAPGIIPPLSSLSSSSDCAQEPSLGSSECVYAPACACASACGRGLISDCTEGCDNGTPNYRGVGDAAALPVCSSTVACEIVQVMYANASQNSSISSRGDDDGGGGGEGAVYAHADGDACAAQEYTTLSIYDDFSSLTPLPRCSCSAAACVACTAQLSVGPSGEGGCTLQHLRHASTDCASSIPSPPRREKRQSSEERQLGSADELLELQDETFTEAAMRQQHKMHTFPDALEQRLDYAALLSSAHSDVQQQQEQQRSIAPHSLHSRMQSSFAPLPPLQEHNAMAHQRTTLPLPCRDGFSSPLSSLTSDDESQCGGTHVVHSASPSQGGESDDEDDYDAPPSPTTRRRIHPASAHHHNDRSAGTMLWSGFASTKSDPQWKSFVERSIHGPSLSQQQLLCRLPASCSTGEQPLATAADAPSQSLHQRLYCNSNSPPTSTTQTLARGGMHKTLAVDYDGDDVFQSQPLHGHASMHPPGSPNHRPGTAPSMKSWERLGRSADTERPSTGKESVQSGTQAAISADQHTRDCHRRCCAPQLGAAPSAPFLQPYGYASSPTSSVGEGACSSRQRLEGGSMDEGLSMDASGTRSMNIPEPKMPRLSTQDHHHTRHQTSHRTPRSSSLSSESTAAEEGAAQILISIGKRGRTEDDDEADPEQARKTARDMRAERAERRTQAFVMGQVQSRKPKPAPSTWRIKSKYVEDNRGDMSADPTNVPGVITYAAYCAQLKNTDHLRIFPDDMLMLPDHFPLWYCRYHVPSSMDAARRERIFGVRDNQPASVVADPELRAALMRSRRSMGVWREPESLLDMYNTRWTRGVSADKVALCPICFENGKAVFLKTKASQYNYHLLNVHGISPVTKRPFDPPVEFRHVKVDRPAKHDRKRILEGFCRGCRKWVKLQSIREIDVQVPELYWWKHAAPCQKKHGALPNMGGLLIEDELLRRITEYIDDEDLRSE